MSIKIKIYFAKLPCLTPGYLLIIEKAIWSEFNGIA